jgi:large subunit ribosomal protein L18
MRTVKKRFDIRSSRVRTKISKVSSRPRLCVTKSNRHIYAQVIDDSRVLAAYSTMSKEIKKMKKSNCNEDCAILVGKKIGELAKQRGIEKVVFDRGGVKYQGVIKAAADAARANLEF